MEKSHSEDKTVVLGDEYDTALRDALLQTLRELGGIATDKWSGVSGSQDIQHLEVLVGGKTLRVEAETYIGLTVSGAPEIVDRVATRVQERRSACVERLLDAR